jgi:hypothetical protein
MMNPVRTWESAVGLLTLLYAYGCGSYLLYIIANPGRFDLRSMLWILAGLCCVVAFVEVVISHARHRSVNVVFAGTALTVCAILMVALSVRIIPYLLHPLSAFFQVFVRLAISLGPPCCLAAATWIGRGTLENYRGGIEDTLPGEEVKHTTPTDG